MRTARRESTNYVVGGSLETQLALVNLGCIAVHVMAGRATAPRKSDWLCFDLDPATRKIRGRGSRGPASKRSASTR